MHLIIIYVIVRNCNNITGIKVLIRLNLAVRNAKETSALLKFENS